MLHWIIKLHSMIECWLLPCAYEVQIDHCLGQYLTIPPTTSCFLYPKTCHLPQVCACISGMSLWKLIRKINIKSYTWIHKKNQPHQPHNQPTNFHFLYINSYISTVAYALWLPNPNTFSHIIRGRRQIPLLMLHEQLSRTTTFISSTKALKEKVSNQIEDY